jgi:hypothetical protein
MNEYSMILNMDHSYLFSLAALLLLFFLFTLPGLAPPNGEVAAKSIFF